VTGLDPANLAGSLAQTSDPVGQTRGTHRLSPPCGPNWLLFKRIIIHLNSNNAKGINMHA
jgi:hypothetical protein